MAIRSFKDKATEDFFWKGQTPRRVGWKAIGRIARRKLDMLHYAAELKDLRSPPSNCLESLGGDWRGCYSIRINDQWRVVFCWDVEAFDVQIVDYH